MKSLDKFTERVSVFIIGFLLGIIISCMCNNNNNTNTPIEKSTNIDSLIKVNDNIKLQVEHLDSIKNAEIIEVIALDNDSTLRLFYKLVKE